MPCFYSHIRISHTPYILSQALKALYGPNQVPPPPSPRTIVPRPPEICEKKKKSKSPQRAGADYCPLRHGISHLSPNINRQFPGLYKE